MWFYNQLSQIHLIVFQISFFYGYEIAIEGDVIAIEGDEIAIEGDAIRIEDNEINIDSKNIGPIDNGFNISTILNTSAFSLTQEKGLGNI